jgi:hypothetical protein
MNGFEVWLMLATSLNPLAPGEGIGKTGGLVLRDVLLILGSGLFLLVLLLAWVRFYVRRPKRARHRHHHRNSSTSPAIHGPDPDAVKPHAPPTPDTPHDRSHHHRRRRRHRRDHRGRNPSLAEAGGLPPRRSGPPPAPLS